MKGGHLVYWPLDDVKVIEGGLSGLGHFLESGDWQTAGEDAFLIARDHETAFDAKVKSIASRFDKLTFKYTGPWPPYNFVNIRLKLERA